MSKGIPCSVSCASRVAVQFGAFDGSLFYLVYFMGRWFCFCQKSLFPFGGCLSSVPGSVWCDVKDRWF